MDDGNMADESVYLVPENHPLVVLSDDEDAPEENVIKIKTQKIDMRIKREDDEPNLKRKRNADKKVNSKKMKVEENEDIVAVSTATAKAEAELKGTRKRTIKKEEETKCKRVKLEKSEDTAPVSKTAVKKEEVGLKGVRKTTIKKEAEIKPIANFDFESFASSSQDNGPVKQLIFPNTELNRSI